MNLAECENKQASLDPELEIRNLAAGLCARKLEVPAIFFLELYKPLTSIFHASVLAGTPLLNVLFGRSAATKLAWLLESREHIEQLIRAIEERVMEQRLKDRGSE